MPDENEPSTVGTQAGAPKTNFQPEEQRTSKNTALSSSEVYRPPSENALRWITVGGMLFLVLAGGAFSVAVFLLYYLTVHGSPMGRVGPSESSIVQQVFGLYLAPVLTFLVGLVAAGIGSMLLRIAGTATRDVIPKQDHVLLTKLILDGNTAGIDSYVKLSSLTGTIGTFTQLGISGLPLATISLTVLFAVLGLLVSEQTVLFDLAKLTLGAFIGSYVQRQSTESVRGPTPFQPPNSGPSTPNQ